MADDQGIDYFNRAHPLHRLKARVALAARRRMFERVMALIQPEPGTRVLDVGTTPDTTIPYNNFFERWYPFPERLTISSIEDCSNLEAVFPGVRFVPLTPGRLPFADREFDVAVSFAVLEHVGGSDAQQLHVRELERVARRVVLYTPYRFFPIEMHTMLPLTHWLPAPIYRRLWRAAGLPFWADEQNLNLLSRRDIRALLPPTGRTTIRLFRTMGWPSNIEVVWNAD